MKQKPTPAEELTEYAYSEEKMREILGGSEGPIEHTTMRKRIYRRDAPPFIKVGSDYWFPKDAFSDWLQAQRPVTKGKNAS